MHQPNEQRLSALVLGFGLLIASAAVYPQAYPEKPIRLLMPFPPGGASEGAARPAMQKLGASLGRPIVLDARPGAAGIIAAELASKSVPDGYTLLFASSALFSILPGLRTDLPYDPIRGYAPITQLVSLSNALIVHPSIPARSVGELIAYAKQNPEKLSYASGGNGTTFHLAGELFKLMAGVKLTHVPYKGGAPAQIDVIAGQVPVMFDSLSTALIPIRGGRVRALAVSTRQRSQVLPDVPTVSEAGLPGFEVAGWFGVVAPAGTPRPIVSRLSSELRTVMNSAEISERLTSQGYAVATSTPDDFARFIAAELKKYARVIKDTGIRIE